jgi:hypothetical protein
MQDDTKISGPSSGGWISPREDQPKTEGKAGGRSWKIGEHRDHEFNQILSKIDGKNLSKDHVAQLEKSLKLTPGGLGPTYQAAPPLLKIKHLISHLQKKTEKSYDVTKAKSELTRIEKAVREQIK